MATATRSPAAAPEDVILVEGLRAGYGSRLVLEDVSFRVGERETLAVVGSSGCGKSTLLRCLIGLLQPLRGRIRIFGEDIASLDRHDLDQLRRRIGVAFQGSALLNSLSVEDNVALPLREHTRLDEATIRIMARLKLEQVGLAGAGQRLPAELSGGMRKRAGIARALAMDPRVLFLDEPSAGLDPITAVGLDNLLADLRSVLGLTLVVVTHELESVMHIADRVLMLDRGRVRLDGTLEDSRRSTDPRVRQFFDRQPDADPAGGQGIADDLRAPEEPIP